MSTSNWSHLDQLISYKDLTIIVLDLETTVQEMEGQKDNSPYNPCNKIVAAGWLVIKNGEMSKVKTSVFYHKERPITDSPEELKADLANADLLVCHNAKFDYSYLLASGFECPSVYCTMIGEYIFARGQDVRKSLKETAERRDVTRKKDALVDELFKSGTGFEAMPIDTVMEYLEADVQSCAEIYLSQMAELNRDENKSLMPIFLLMNEMLLFLTEIESNGIKIDLPMLDQVEHELEEERKQLKTDLDNLVAELMGDTPINLHSGPDMTKVIYSREVLDRDAWKRIFNIGTNARGKALPPRRMKQSQFVNTVKYQTKVIKRTVAHHCNTCNGKGHYRKYKKDGTPYKNLTGCSECDKRGYLLIPTEKVAGLKLIPEGVLDVSINGFKTDKGTLKKLIRQATEKGNDKAVEFLTKITRLHAVSNYIDTSIKGIRTWVRSDGILHAQFNQCTTRTGRLSSSNPNFQNQPKKFPVRRCVVSRFEGGECLEMDYSGLEFRVAGLLSGDQQIKDDILNGKDIHRQTASIIYECDPNDVSKELRQASKQFTFSPLYGGMGANEAPHVKTYFKEFFNVYKGLKEWHTTLTNAALKDGIVKIPSGREFAFPNVKRLAGGRVSNQTNIVNYPCQSFATADIVPLACVRAFRRFKDNNLKSKLILTVHDSLVVDVFPGERQKVLSALTWAMRDIDNEIYERFNFKVTIPLDVEAEIGPNWMDTKEISVDV